VRIVVLKEGSIVCSHQDQAWLFGAPNGIREALDAHGIEVPNVVFTTSLRAPGLGHLNKAVMRFKEQPLKMNGWSAIPLSRKHGTDYVIDSGNARILFSERGDVSTEDTEGYHLAIIKNKHRSDKMGTHVITWPWADSEYLVNEGTVTPIFKDESFKVWSDIADVPDNLKEIDGAKLTVAQANYIARIAKGSGEGGEENWAIGISSFKKAYQKDGDHWVEKEKVTTKEEKVSQEVAKYDPTGGHGMMNCATCEYFLPEGACQKVEGTISPEGLSSLWEKGEAMGEPEETHMEVKEFVDGKPVPRVIDILTANLHKAYNDTSDHLFKLGYLNQDERLDIAQSIGKGLDAFRSAIQSKDFAERAVDRWDTELPTYKEEVFVYKDAEGNERWASISSVAMWDRQGEFLTTKAMDWAIAFAKLTGYKGPLRFKHVPGLDGGDCDTQFRIGDYLFESGTFRDNQVGELMKAKMKSNEGYQISLGLAFAKEDMQNGVYQRAAIFERSMTKKPAVPVTSIITKEEIEMKIMTEEELKTAADELGMDLTEVKTMYERALAAGNPLNSQGLKEALKEAKPGGAKEDNEESGYTREQMKEILEGLTVAEFKELESLITEVKQDGEADMDEEEEPEEEVEEAPKAKKKETERLDNLERLVLEQTKAMGSLASALVGRNTTDLEAAVGRVLGQMPREQASRFVSQQTKSASNGVNDNEIVNQLKQVVEEALAKQASSGPKAVYDLFTSKNLNKG